MKRTLVRLFAAGFLASAATACLPRTQGELQNGGFTYFCAGDSDLACEHSSFNEASDVPPAIAVGAHFDLKFSPPVVSSGSQPSVTDLTPVAPSILQAEAGSNATASGFRFVAPGTVAVLARGGGVIVDFLHVTGAAIDRVDVVDDFGNAKTALALPSFGATVDALPRDEHGQTLAGALSYTWESSDESVVSVAARSQSNSADLTAEGPGTATITVTVQGKQSTVEVTVGGVP